MFAADEVCALPMPARPVARQYWRDGPTFSGQRFLAEEVPVAVSYDGTTHAVLMATPDNLDDFALGFSLTEGIVRRPDEIAELGIVGCPDGIVLRMWLSGERSDAFAARRRRFVGPAGCGMCGLESLAEANRAIPRVPAGLRVSPQQIAEAVAALPCRQALNRLTRSVHAAGFAQPDHELVVREDVGRHNALDKLAGALMREGRSAASGILVLSSRISIELVQKAGMMGAPILVGISAPTALAASVAEAIGITLVGIARDDGFEVFSHPERIACPNAFTVAPRGGLRPLPRLQAAS
jgi:FdhD protein